MEVDILKKFYYLIEWKISVVEILTVKYPKNYEKKYSRITLYHLKENVSREIDNSTFYVIGKIIDTTYTW